MVVSAERPLGESVTADHGQLHAALAQLRIEIAADVHGRDTQAMAGVKTYIKIPDLNLGNGKKVAIAEARLELTNADASGIYAPPASLILYEEDTARDAFFLEEQYQGDSYFGGSYDASQKSYFFRIPRYIQNIINGNRNKTRKLYLLSSSASVRGNRLIFYGTEPVIEYNQRLRLRVIYTHLP